MSRYIDIEPIIARHTDVDYKTSDISFSEFLYAPSIDIVRCKECKVRTKRAIGIDGMGYCSKLIGWTNDTDFCSWGERKGE